jgi:hypothetical protein
MPDYLLLLYRTDDEARSPERKAEGPLWEELNQSLREAGLLISDARLHPVATSTTVRIRGGSVDLTDGPFATTKEVLAGYYLIRCADLDQALRQATRVPMARYGSVEVRPVVTPDEPAASGPARAEGGAAAAE